MLGMRAFFESKPEVSFPLVFLWQRNQQSSGHKENQNTKVALSGAVFDAGGSAAIWGILDFAEYVFGSLPMRE